MEQKKPKFVLESVNGDFIFSLIDTEGRLLMKSPLLHTKENCRELARTVKAQAGIAEIEDRTKD